MTDELPPSADEYKTRYDGGRGCVDRPGLLPPARSRARCRFHCCRRRHYVVQASFRPFAITPRNFAIDWSKYSFHAGMGLPFDSARPAERRPQMRRTKSAPTEQ